MNQDLTTSTLANARLAWQQAIDNYTEAIVDEAEATIKKARMDSLKAAMGTAQLSNFLGVTLETSSVAAIVNWVRYQMGRRETSRAWKDTQLGATVVDSINKMRQWAIDIARDVYGEPKPPQILEIHVALVRLYAGYLKRWYIAEGGQQ